MAQILDPGKLALHKLIPAEVKGRYRRMRTKVHLGLMLFFLILPWIKIGNYQSILLDISKRKFYFFGQLFHAHEVPLLFFLVAFSFLTLALVTSLWGRAWCGWACPQTVFIDSVFRRIETWIEGNYITRRRNQNAPVSAKIFFQKTLKWILFTLVSSLIAHSFLAYFVGSHELLEMMKQPPSQNQTYFLLVSAATGLILFNFGWFREQFCTIMCPYGRFQNVLLEPSTVMIAYDQKRGEPRRGTSTNPGDCVACNRCVEVCPTGIDIRNGIQLECINCTACADACDEIMEKVNKPKSLIGYQSWDGSRFTFKRFKTFFYGGLMVLCAGGFSYALSVRAPFDVTILRGKGLPYSVIMNEKNEKIILNHFKMHVVNQTKDSANLKLRVTSDQSELTPELISGVPILKLGSGELKEWHFFIKIPIDQRTKAQFKLNVVSENGVAVSKEIKLLGPN